MLAIVVIVASYLLGSLLFSVLISRLVKGVDIRSHGSGNAGATNTLRVIGLGPALLVFVLDLAKGVTAVLLASWVVPDAEWVQVASGLAAICGHNWPVFFKFRGGKGIATTIGMVVALAPMAGIAAGVVAILSIVFTRYVSLGSLLFTALFPVFVFALSYSSELFWGSLVITAFAWFRHRTNIVKLVQGRENKLGSKKKMQQL